MVPVVSVEQNIPCRVQRLYVVHHLHRLLSAARLSTGSAVVHCLHDGPSSTTYLYTRLPTHYRRTDTASAAVRLEQGITNVGRWMCANHLKLNADKTELLWVGSRVTQSFPARRQVRCNLQVTLCDPYLSALSVRYYKKCAI